MKSATILACGLAVLLIAACGDAEQGGGVVANVADTEEPTDSDGDDLIDGVPTAVNDWFTLEELQLLYKAGLEIYTGDEPPSVEGYYIANTQRITYDSTGASGSLMRYDYWLTDQTTADALQVGYESTDTTDSSESEAYIAGEDNCFSVFTSAEGYNTIDTCTYKRATVYSGCMDSTDSIAGFSFGFIMTETEGDCTATLPEGSIRIIKESDGLAVSHDE